MIPSRAAMALLGFLVMFGCVSDSPRATSFNDAPAVEMVQDLRIDGYAHDLVPISWLVVSPHGTMAASQGQDHRVRLFDAMGNDIGFVGGEGDGPGEFRTLRTGGWVGDTLWVYDLDNARVSFFSSKSEYLGSLPPLLNLRPAEGDEEQFGAWNYPVVWAVPPGPELLVSALPMVGEASLEGVPVDAQSLFKVSKDGLVLEEVGTLPQAQGGRVPVRFEGGSGVVSVPFFPRPSITYAQDGSRFGTLTTDLTGEGGGEFHVTLYDHTGTQLSAQAFPFEGTPIPEALVDSVLEARAERAPVPAMARAYRNEVKALVPPVYPPVQRLLLGTDGRTWFELRVTQEGRPWVILDPTGGLLGRVTVPMNVELVAAAGNHVWALETDEFDVESIVRYRLDIEG